MNYNGSFPHLFECQIVCFCVCVYVCVHARSTSAVTSGTGVIGVVSPRAFS